MTLKNGISARVFLKILDHDIPVLIIQNKLYRRRAERYLSLKRRAEEKSRRITEAVEEQKDDVIAQRTDESGNDQAPNGALNKAKTGSLQTLTLFTAALQGMRL